MRGYYGFGVRVDAPPSESSARVDAPPSSDLPKTLSMVSLYPNLTAKILSSVPSPPSTVSPFGPVSFSLPGTQQTNYSQQQQQSVMYQCPNGKLISTPNISLCEEGVVSSSVDSDFGKYLLPIGIILAAVLLLK